VEGAGRHFDPEIVSAFLSIEDEFKRIAASFADHA
jgi:putative two-component system response regulator